MRNPDPNERIPVNWRGMSTDAALTMQNELRRVKRNNNPKAWRTRREKPESTNESLFRRRTARA